ncbi:MAG: PKD domain-containing protein [Verrucomicrobiota bacterium]
MLLDTTPLTSGSSAAGKADSGLDIGKTYSDFAAKIHITPVGYGGSDGHKYLDVQVHTGTSTSGACAATIGGPSSIYARTTAAFTAPAASSTGATLAYVWDAGDGTITAGSGVSASTFTHAYTTGGTYTLKLSISDMKGSTASGSLSVNVTDPAQIFTKRNNSTSADINAVAASDTIIVAVGASASSTGNRFRSSSDGITWTERPVPDTTPDLHMESVIWDGIRFVAVGQDYSSTLGWFGVIYTSTNGISWSRTYTSSTGSSALNAVSAGNGTILAVGDSGTVLRSTDGSIWNSITGIPSVTSGSMSCRGIAFGDGTFVLTARASTSITGAGAVFTSTDNGVSWRDQTSGAGFASASEDFQKIAYLNGKFITSGYFSKLKTGTFNNGTLTFSSSQTGYEQANVLSYASGLYFGSGFTLSQTNGVNTYTPVNLYSTDGGTWSTSTPKAGMEYQNDGAFFNNRLVSVGSLGAIYQSGSLATSNNAPVISSLVAQTTRSARIPITLVVSATDADGDALSYRWDAGDGIHSGTSSVFTNTYAAGGTYSVSVTVNDRKGGSVNSGTSLVVSDPFTLRTTGTTETLNGIASNGSLAVAVGNKGKVLTSTNGGTWTSRTVESFSSNMYLDQISWDGFQFIAVGMDNQAGTSSGWKRIIYTSPNGINWTNRYPSSSSTQQYHFRSVASSGGTILVGGDSGLLVRSIDSGTSWSTVGSGTISSSHRISGLAYGAGTFLITTYPQSVDSISQGDGRVYTTSGGSALTDVSGAALGTGYYLDTVAYLNDRFVSSGSDTPLRASTNKAATFTISATTTEQAHALVYGNGFYLAAGLDADSKMVHAVSTDGANWTQTSAPNGAASENAATFFNNTFLIVGGSGQIWQSGTVTVGGGPLEILTQPSALTINEGTEATFSVLAVGSGTLSYQWNKNGTPISSGGTNSSFTLPSTATTDSGSYSVQITDSATSSSLTSGSVALLVNAVNLQSGSLVSIQPTSNVALVKGSEATLAITLFTPAANVSQTTYTLYSGTATALAVSGSVSTNGIAFIPLKSLTESGSYSVRFERASPASKVYDFSQTFNVTFTTWDSAAGTYQTLLANDSTATSALNDGSVYRGFLSLTVSRFGAVSGRLYYNEASLLSGGTSGERLYAPITRSFSGKFVPKVGTPSTMTLTPSKLGTAAQSLRESLTLELDLSALSPKMSAKLTDSVSLASGSCISSATEVTKAASSLSTGDLTSLVGKYLVAANVTNNTATYEQQAYLQTQVLSNGRLLWSSRLKGHAGTGTTYLNTTDATAPFAGLYEGSLITNTKLHNSYSLLGELGFQLNAGSWAASIGSPELASKLEKQASYVARQTTDSGSLAAVYNSAYFSSGTNSTGVKYVSFSDNNRARWSGATFTGIPAFLPTAGTLTLSLQDPVNSSAAPLLWTLSVGSSGMVTTQPQMTGGVAAPSISLRFTRATGLWSGVYVLSGARRTLVGATVDQGTAAATKAAQGWAESGVVPNIKTGTWTISK